MKLSNEEKNEINVGVIDGGIPKNSIIQKELYKYEDNETLGWGINPKGTHAESVCSLLLWSNKLDSKTNDYLTSPNVSLFNVINKNDTVGNFQNKVEKIIRQHSL